MAKILEDKKSFDCDFCDKNFSFKGNLNKHIKSVHEGKKPFKCKVCDKCFSVKCNLNSHIESVHE